MPPKKRPRHHAAFDSEVLMDEESSIDLLLAVLERKKAKATAQAASQQIPTFTTSSTYMFSSSQGRPQKKTSLTNNNAAGGAGTFEMKSFWNGPGNTLLKWYNQAMSLGKPRASSTLSEFQYKQCNCVKQKKSVLLYLFDGQYTKEVEHCNCQSLCEALVSNQFVPATLTVPEKAIQFSVFDNFHDNKLTPHVLVEAYNARNKQNHKGPNAFQLMSLELFQPLDLLYRQMMTFAKEKNKH